MVLHGGLRRPAYLRPTFEGLGVEALGDFADRSLRAWGLGAAGGTFGRSLGRLGREAMGQ